MGKPVRYSLLRDGSVWSCPLPTAVQFSGDGSLVLAGSGASAVIDSGCLDAGIDSDWERVCVQAQTPVGSGVSLYTFTSADAAATPQWLTQPEPGLDILLDRAPGPAPTQPATRRYLWLRIRLDSGAGFVSPVLEQVQAQTGSRSYLEDLPAIYRRDDRPTRFLERWLALFRSDMQGFEQALDELPHLFDPQMARANQLAWVAQCLAFEPPADLRPTQLRKLLQRVPSLYARRGTVAGLEDWAEVFSGLRPKIIEAWRSRRIWQLGSTSLLGFDTMLAASAPDGLIVPGEPLTDPGYVGLLRETFGGPAFESSMGPPRIDRTLAFSAAAGTLTLAPKDAGGNEVNVATLRWTGQIKPRHAERYTISLRVAGVAATDDVRVRFWIDGRPLIEDLWTDASASQGVVQTLLSIARDLYLRMEEPRWYPLRLEVRTTANALTLSLAWSSRSQRPEIVPAECLYALTDDRADTSRTHASGFDVGSAVVGASGPQAPGDFGQGLFSDSAHLFTVLVPPSCDCGPGHNPRHQRLRDAIDAEKPAHTDYHLCFLKPRMRVGFQARLGIDAIVASGPPPGRLDEIRLGRNSFLADTPAPTNHTHDPAHIKLSEDASWTP
jgi:phage tail-like protein